MAKKFIKTPILAYNYKVKHKLPTKKEEIDFVKNLKPSQKQYAHKLLMSFQEMWGESPDWNGTVKYRWYQRICRKLLGKGEFEK